jgi:cytochrome P450 family 9
LLLLLSSVLNTEWDDDDLTAQVFVFFLAGFETASTLLSFATHQLAVHPDVQSRLQEEIDMTLNKDGGNLTYEAVHGMKYLDMVVSGMVQKAVALLYPINTRVCVSRHNVT